MRVGIIGMGHVGKAMRQVFEAFADIVEYDVATDSKYPDTELAGCDFAVVCVSTPMQPDRSCDIANVRDAVARLPLDRVLLKSTVAPGTTDLLIAETGKHICFSPEYFGESSYFSQFVAAGPAATPFVILGGSPEDRQSLIDDLCPALGPDKTYFQCSAIEAEVVKYMENAYLATKVTFVNEFYEICRAFGADWHTVREGWLLDPRIERAHTLVFRDNRGFGGRCLPKDVNAVVEAAAKAGYDPQFLRAVLESNRLFGGDSG
jgi:UDPglucose 6-dehydrogenase